MSTLSLHENDAMAARAAKLRRIIEDNADSLRGNDSNRSVVHEGTRFYVVQRDRNIVYRVSDGMGWYLKMPVNDGSDAIKREILGAEAVRRALGGISEYELPQSFCACAKNRYTLMSEVEGQPVNKVLYRSFLPPLPMRRARAEETFSRFGRVLGRLHRRDPPMETRMTRPLVATALAVIRKATRPDDVSRRVEQFVSISPSFGPQRCVAHGNLTFGNVLCSSEKVSLIDFECCGRGSVYEDLSLVCGHLVYSTAALHLPVAPLWRVMNAFVVGYREEGEFDPDYLARAIAIRVGQSYAYWFCCERGRPTVAGLPMSGKRVRCLVDELTMGDPLRALGRISNGRVFL